MQTVVILIFTEKGIKLDWVLSDLTVPGVCVYKEHQPKKDRSLFTTTVTMKKAFTLLLLAVCLLGVWSQDGIVSFETLCVNPYHNTLYM